MTMQDWIFAEFDIVNTSATYDWRIDCPFCPEPDTKQHMYISINRPGAHCFRCGWKGSHFEFVKEYTGVETNAEVWAILRDPVVTVAQFKTVLEQLQVARMKEKRSITGMPDWYVPFSEGNVPTFALPVFHYARKRLSMANIAYHGIGYCNDPDSMNTYRMIIPIERGYYQARSIVRKPDRKYVNPDYPVDDRLFNYQALQQFSAVAIAEGAISAIAIGKNAIATLGNNGATMAQKERLRLSPVRHFIIAYDAGMEYSRRVAELAAYLYGKGKEVTIRQYLEGDPDTCTEFIDMPYSSKYKAISAQLNAILPRRLHR